VGGNTAEHSPRVAGLTPEALIRCCGQLIGVLLWTLYRARSYLAQFSSRRNIRSATVDLVAEALPGYLVPVFTETLIEPVIPLH